MISSSGDSSGADLLKFKIKKTITEEKLSESKRDTRETELHDLIMFYKDKQLSLPHRRIIDGIKSKRLARADDTEWDKELERHNSHAFVRTTFESPESADETRGNMHQRNLTVDNAIRQP